MDNPSALGQREDLQALGLVILELVFAALAEGNTASGAQLQRLLLDVFAADTHAFRLVPRCKRLQGLSCMG